ncbi:hypothetical protein [Paenirhodobacter sp.]|uniref:hypothetical protein n=1 Tax=Paenirhodobacter sp. TaxID=1965326 RepID=UPI003B41E012
MLRDESQGITDVVIKLYMLAQLRAIQLGELGGRAEVIDAGLIRHVAKTELTLIAPIIDALRRGDQRAVQRYDDLMPLDGFVRQSLQDAAVRLRPKEAEEPMRPAAPVRQMPTDTTLLPMLEEMGIAGDIAAVLLAEVRASMPDAGMLDLVGAVCDRLRARGPEAKPVKARPKPKPKVSDAEVPGDLRRIAEGAADAHAAFLQADWIRSPFSDVA